MLKLIRLASTGVDVNVAVTTYVDEDLIDVNFGLELCGLARGRALTKFRLFRGDGAVVSLEMRGGLICGAELLGIRPGCWDVQVEYFSEISSQAQEVPAIGFELDGMSTTAAVGVMTIDQKSEFEVRWARAMQSLEITFDECHRASVFSGVAVFFNGKSQVSGFRVTDCPGLFENGA